MIKPNIYNNVIAEITIMTHTNIVAILKNK